MANKNAAWDFDLVSFETLQFSRYDVGQFYDWHPDQSAKLYQDEAKKNMTRKIISYIFSITITCDFKNQRTILSFNLFYNFGYRNKYFIFSYLW